MSFKPTRNQKYYLPDTGMAVFKVEDNLYKVHRHFFIQESSVFQSMFDCPTPAAGQDGKSDEKPIYLPEVTRAEFEALLDFFYNGMFEPLLQDTPVRQPWQPQFSYSAIQPTYMIKVVDTVKHSRLIDLLSISLRFVFDRVAKVVTAAIDAEGAGMDPIPKILLASRHDTLRHWMQPAFNSLVSKSAPLTGEEMKGLGPTRSAIICSYREKRHHDYPSSFRSGLPTTVAGNLAVPSEFYIASSF